MDQQEARRGDAPTGIKQEPASSGGAATGNEQPGIVPRARFADEPLPGPDGDLARNIRRQLHAALKGPALPRSLKYRRTRHVNADPRVSRCRAAAIAVIANTYADAGAALRAMEKRFSAGSAATEVARLAAINPAAFGEWYGAARPDVSHHHRPDRARLVPALAELAEALDAAGREAARLAPAPVRARGSRNASGENSGERIE